MSSPEVSTARIVLLDWSQFFRHGARLLIASVVIFAVYWLLLSASCAIAGRPLGSLAMTVSQIVMGLYLVGKYRHHGVESRKMIRFFDPSDLEGGWHMESRTTSQAELSRVIERWHETASKQDLERVDDLTDVGLFVIVVTGIFLGVSDLAVASSVPAIQLSVVVLGGISLVMFSDGFRTATSALINEDLDHLEYLLRFRLKVFERLHAGCQLLYIIRWARLTKGFVVYDFGIGIDGKLKDGTKAALTYWAGLPSKDLQRFEFRTATVTDEFVTHALANPLVVSSGWTVGCRPDSIVICEKQSSLNLHRRSSYVRPPEDIQQDATSLQDGVRDLLDTLPLVCS